MSGNACTVIRVRATGYTAEFDLSLWLLKVRARVLTWIANIAK